MALAIINRRLRNQRLTGAPLATPADVVSWLGAVQAQEYGESKWALALRTRRTTDDEIERAFGVGAILRTHVLRPTWHFVTPADIRWMLSLTGPRVSRVLATYHRRFALDAALFRKAETVMARALRGGAHLTRQELKLALQRAGVNTDGAQKLAFITIQAEIDAVICSGGRRGNQFTYALLDERVPQSPSLSRDAALAELTRRYFISRGPAQLHDFSWWSGLTITDARSGLEMVGKDLVSETIDTRTYWFAAKAVGEVKTPERALLLGAYDEYLIAYKDRSATQDSSGIGSARAREFFNPPVIVDGKVVGAWKKKVSGGRAVITVTPVARLASGDVEAVTRAARRYATFAGQELQLLWA